MLKLLIKNNLLRFLSQMGQKNGKNNKKRTALSLTGTVVLMSVLALLFLFAFGVMAIGFGVVAGDMPDGTWFFGAMAAVLSFLMAFIGSIFFTTSAVFESKDNELLLSMPIPPGDIILSRLLSLLLMDELYGWIVLLPFGVVGGFLGLFSLPGLLLYFLAGLFLPLFTMAVTCLIAWGISALTSRMKHPKLFQTILMFVSFALYMVFYIGMQNLGTLLVEHADKIRNVLSNLYPLCLMGQAAEGNLPATLLLLGISLLSAWFAWFLLKRSFIRLVTTRVAAAKKVYRPSRDGLKVRSPFMALTFRDVRRFLVTPMYLFNAGMGLLMTLGASIFLLVKADTLLSLLPEFGITTAATLFPFLAMGLSLLSAMTGISAPSVSLEGKSLWILRSSPLSGRDILRSKALSHLILTTPVNALSSLLVGIALKEILSAFLLFLVLTGFTAFVAYVGAVIGCFMARFDFPSETAVIKQSGAVGVTLLIAFLASLILPAPGIALTFVFSPTIGLLAQFLLCFLAAALMRLLLVTGAARRFDKLSA